MALDSAWIGVIGTGGGAAIVALGAILGNWAKAATEGKQQRLAEAEKRKDESAEAKAVREHNAAEKAAQREHDAAEKTAQRERDATEAEAERQRVAVQREADQRAAKRAERVDTIRKWREGLAAAHTEYEDWRSMDQQGVYLAAPLPNIVSASWFQSLRQYMSPSGPAQNYCEGFDIQCDREAAGRLGAEIARIESAWGLELDLD